MGHAEVTVQRLALRLRDAGAPVHTLRARVEDALRVSSKPAALVHRFVLVRRLRMSLPREASAQRLALWLEREWRRLEALAEPIAEASPEAAAVWATDEAAARVALLRRWLRGEPAQAWYWRRLVPQADASVPLVQRIERLLFEPIESIGPEVAAPIRGQTLSFWRDALREVDTAGCAAPLFAALGESRRAELRSIARPGPEPARGRASAAGATEIVAPAGRTGFGPARAAVPALVPGEPPSVEPGFASMTATRADGPPAGFVVPPRVSPESAFAAQAAPSATRARAGGETALHAPPCRAESASAAEGETTAWAGLWFVLPLLTRQGIGQLDHAAAMLEALLRRAAVRHLLDEPAWRWIDRVAQHAESQAVPEREADAWWRETRIASLRQTRLPLRRLMSRRGRVWIAPHRIDLLLPLNEVDIRIRRAGLDIDPGYLPWLGCVVRFHYT